MSVAIQRTTHHTFEMKRREKKPEEKRETMTFFLLPLQVYKNLHQRIVYRSYEGTATYSSLEIQSSSQILQDIFQSASKYLANINVLCEVSILHVYHKNVQVKIALINPIMTTVSPNLLGLEKASIGDPDNSPLTGAGARTAPMPQINHLPHLHTAIVSAICWYFYSTLFHRL